MIDFETLDTNNDNTISTEEAKQVPELDTQAEFSIADENKDNYISFDEYNKVAQQAAPEVQEVATPSSTSNDVGTAIMEFLKNRNTEAQATQQAVPTAEPQIQDWKADATEYANTNFNTPKEKGRWDEFIRRESEAEDIISKINPRIDKTEVEQIVFEDYVRKAKEKGTNKDHPIQITEVEKNSEAKEEQQEEEKAKEEKPVEDERKKILLDAANHIISHGKSLPKEMKKKLQEITPKFEPFKFEHSKSSSSKETDVPTDELKIDSEKLESAYATPTEASVPTGSISSSSSGSVGRLSSANPMSKFDFGVKKSSNNRNGGGMTYKEPNNQQPMKLNFANSNLIGDFKSKKKPINLEIPKSNKSKKVEFPDLAPEVEQHNDMDVPKSSKSSRPIIKAGLYQDKEDKIDNDIYSKVIDYIVTNYEKWNKDGDIYSYKINNLGVIIYYDCVSQPKIRVDSDSSFGGNTTQNISTLLNKPGGRVLLGDIYKYLVEK